MSFDFSKLSTLSVGAQAQPAVTPQSAVQETVQQPVVKEAAPAQETATQSPVVAPVSVKPPVVVDDSIFDLDDVAIDNKRKDISSKLTKIESELNGKFIERADEIRMLLLGIVSGTNSFLHGPAGTGKSQLTEDISNRIVNSNYFRILMGKTTEPAEVFGPVSVNALKNDSYKVNTENKLPTAHIAFLDEVFKANSAVLNSLLTIMNEKLFFNDTVEEVPTISVIGASNEYYEDDSLVALYDRFLLRWHVDYIKDPSNRMDLFKGFLNSRKKKSKLQGLVAATTKDTATTIELEEVLIANELCKEVDISLKILKEYNKLFLALEKKGIMVSDRRKNEALKVLQASALIEGRTSVELGDFDALKYVLWNEQSQLPVLIEQINKIASPNANVYDEYSKSLAGYKADLAAIEETKGSPDYELDKSIKLTEIHKGLQFAINNIATIVAGLKPGSKDAVKFENLAQDMQQFVDEVRGQILV